jgi:hypothetical protein
MKTATSDFLRKKYSLDINAFLRRKPTEKTTVLTVISVYCGFGTLVAALPAARAAE